MTNVTSPMMRGAFARDENGNVKHKQPCQTPGCNWPNWHICLDKSDPTHTQVHEVKRNRRMTQSQKEAIAESQRQRWADRRAATKERDEKIIRLYKDDNMGMSAIASVTGLAQSTINKVLHQAQKEGILKIAQKGFTRSRPGRTRL